MASPNFSYSGDPGASTRDAFRFILGDTDPDDPQVYDPEADWLLETNNDDPYEAAARAAANLAARFAKLVDKQVGDLRISYSQRAQQYRKLADDLKSQSATAGAAARPWLGGVSISEKQAEDQNTDRVRPSFVRDQNDDPQGRLSRYPNWPEQW